VKVRVRVMVRVINPNQEYAVATYRVEVLSVQPDLEAKQPCRYVERSSAVARESKIAAVGSVQP
jgi:hypothetical protein